VQQRVSPYNAKDEQKLMTELWDPEIADDPLKFVMFVFPWKKKGTPLADHEGPREWQREELYNLGSHIRAQKKQIVIREQKKLILQKRLKGIELDKALEPFQPKIYQSAISSGRGIGKSSFTSWLDMWMMSTRLGSTTIVTANTESQLKSRTWAEMGKWHTLALNSHWFEKTALSLKPAEWFEKALKNQQKIDTGYYYSQAQLWSEENPDAFAGVHNYNGILLVFDEASGIPKPIWTVSQGFFTEPILDRYHFVFSNPRRNTGAFYECFHKDRNFWRRRNIDSRKVEGTDKALLQQIIDQHGEDSDEARVEVKGQFPRQGERQFISREIILGAQERDLQVDNYAPLIMGIDIARFGSDKTVFRWRQGRDARSIPFVELKGADNMEVANAAAHWIETTNPDAVCIDAGNGTGVIDRLREMGYKIHEVWFGSKADDPEWANKRTEMWARLREWLNGGCIDNHQDLDDDLSSPQYKFMGSSDKLMLESKEELRKRGHASPDHGDALACTFAVKVPRKDIRASRSSRSRVARGVDYSVI
jgi:hypothetical protein